MLNTLPHAATHCNARQRTAPHCTALHRTALHCDTLQHTATHCNTLQHTAIHCNTLQHTATSKRDIFKRALGSVADVHTADHYNTLQHTATHYNALQGRSQFPQKRPAIRGVFAERDLEDNLPVQCCYFICSGACMKETRHT